MPFFMNVRCKCIRAKLLQTEVFEKKIHFISSLIFESYTIGSFFAASSHDLRTGGVIMVKFMVEVHAQISGMLSAYNLIHCGHTFSSSQWYIH
jgi:hypothetical protein